MSSSEIPIINNSNINSNNNERNINMNENIDNENIDNTLNESEPNKNKLMSSKEWINYFKQSKINLEEINNALLSNVESIDNENLKLKEALNELIKDLKEKEDSLEESLKLISKLKNNYSNLFHQYQTLEKKYIKLNEENEKLKLEQNILNSKKLNHNESQKNFKDEINKMKKDELNMKNSIIERKNENMKLMRENAEIKALLEDMKNKNLDYLGMIKDREDLISEYTNQIKKLENEVNQKNEQIKLLVKFSKSINDENKTNVKELTKQACQTIKLFYNYNNQNNINNNENINNDNNNFHKIIKMIFNNDDLEELKIRDNNINNNQTKNIKITFKLKESILNNISFDDFDIGSNKGIKEYLINIFIKINLLKLELFSSYIREFYFVSFFRNIIQKITCDKNFNCNLLRLRNKIIEIKRKNEKLLNQNSEITLKLFELKNKVNDLNLYIKKIKTDFENNKHKMKEKIEKIIDIYENKIDKLNDKIELYKTKYNKNNDKKIDNNNNINIHTQKYKKAEKNIFKCLKVENKFSFSIISKINKIDTKKHKNNQRKNFNFSLTQSIESNQNQNSTYTNKSALKDGTIKKYHNNNTTEINEKNYNLKKLENEKLKEEIYRLRQEITELVQDINKQQKLISESNFQTKNIRNNCEKCELINNLIINSNLPDLNKLSEIKNILIDSSLDKNIKSIINNIFEIINSLLTDNANYNSLDINNNVKTISSNNNINANQMTYAINHNKNSDLQKIFFSEFNTKIFSSSELKKYHIIYSQNIKNMSELIKIYEKRVNDIKNNINNIKLNLDSTVSDQNNNISFNNKKNNFDERIDNVLYDYKNISDEIIKLKQEKIIFDNTIELIKNFLVMNEKIFIFFVQKKNNVEQYKQYSQKIFNVLRKNICDSLDDISDNNIFLKKLITKLLEANFLIS